jgi:hypothetical protein
VSVGAAPDGHVHLVGHVHLPFHVFLTDMFFVLPRHTQRLTAMFASRDRSGSARSPLTPPLTVPSPVATVIQTFQNIQRCDFEPEPWARFKLEPIQFEDLLRELEKDESLRGYVDHKIRYVPKNIMCAAISH